MSLGGGANSCYGVSTYGYCSGDLWVWCDPIYGLQAMNCGTGMCQTVGNVGACQCGTVDANGVCAGPNGGSGDTTHFYCLTAYNILVAVDCAAASGSSSGFCGTEVTQFGSQTTCFCATCSYFDFQSNSCQPLCPGMQCVDYGSGVEGCQ